MRLFTWLWDVIKGIFKNTATATAATKKEAPALEMAVATEEEEFIEISLTI